MDRFELTIKPYKKTYSGDVSPMSQCRSKGMHYMVKDMRSGYACLICGLAGGLEEIRLSPCSSPPSSDKLSANCEMDDRETMKAIQASQRAFQEAQDAALAQELEELEAQAAAMEQVALLQELEAEEAGLEGLLNELKATVKDSPTPAATTKEAPDTIRYERGSTLHSVELDSPASGCFPVLRYPDLPYGSLASFGMCG